MLIMKLSSYCVRYYLFISNVFSAILSHHPCITVTKACKTNWIIFGIPKYTQAQIKFWCIVIYFIHLNEKKKKLPWKINRNISNSTDLIDSIF